MGPETPDVVKENAFVCGACASIQDSFRFATLQHQLVNSRSAQLLKLACGNLSEEDKVAKALQLTATTVNPSGRGVIISGGPAAGDPSTVSSTDPSDTDDTHDPAVALGATASAHPAYCRLLHLDRSSVGLLMATGENGSPVYADESLMACYTWLQMRSGLMFC